MFELLRRAFWAKADPDKALEVAGRRAFSAFCVPTALAGLAVALLNLPFYDEYRVAIIAGFVLAAFCGAGPIVAGFATDGGRFKGLAALMMGGVGAMLGLIFLTSSGLNASVGLFFYPFIISVTLMFGVRAGAAYCLLIIGLYTAVLFELHIGSPEMSTWWLRYGSMSVVLLVTMLAAGVFRRELIAAGTALAKARRDADAASRAKSDFLANMSHELRTPMNGVIGMADMLARSDINEAARSRARTILHSSEALLVIINNILDYSKIEADKLVLEGIPMSPLAVAREVQELLDVTAAQKGLVLELRTLGEDAWVCGDPARLRQVLINLVGNAIKFTENGGVQIEVLAVPEGDRTDLTISVTDSGIGISDDKLVNIFEPFVQAEVSTTRRYGGTGLGLAISHRIVKAMDGELSVSSVEGRGSRFTLSVRLPSADPAYAERTPAPMPVDTDRPRGGRPRLLIAEDIEVNRLVIASLVGERDYAITFAHDGREAVDLAIAAPFDAIIMDVSMPVLDGLSAARLIREHERDEGLPRTPIIAVTAHALAGDRETILAAGIDDYLAKPISKKCLDAALGRWIGGAEWTGDREDGARLPA